MTVTTDAEGPAAQPAEPDPDAPPGPGRSFASVALEWLRSAGDALVVPALALVERTSASVKASRP